MHMSKHVVVMDILFVISIYIIFLIRNLNLVWCTYMHLKFDAENLQAAWCCYLK